MQKHLAMHKLMRRCSNFNCKIRRGHHAMVQCNTWRMGTVVLLASWQRRSDFPPPAPAPQAAGT